MVKFNNKLVISVSLNLREVNEEIMFSSKLLLSPAAREQCISKLKELPSLVQGDLNNRTQAAVLVPICVHNGDVCFLYTLRSSNLKSHRGQVSFPGGKMDENENLIVTALRETEEEIGIHHSHIDLWDVMPPVQGRTNDLIITPVVGMIKNFDSLVLKPNIDEVEEIFTVPMQVLCDRSIHANYMYNKFPLPVYVPEKHKIWGITGMITHFFLQSFLPSSLYKPDFLRKEFDINELLPSKL